MSENDEYVRKQEIAELAGILTNCMINRVLDPALQLDWRDTVYAAGLASKAVGLVAMEMATEPLTLEQTLSALERIFKHALLTTVMPIEVDQDSPQPHQYHTRQ
jgi:hypothetical protein